MNIILILADGLEYDLEDLGTNFDIIFIDASKSQYKNFFEKYEHLLSDYGLIICDNLAFHGHAENYENIESKNLKALARKIDNFNKWLAQNKKYNTTFLNIGDGMSISVKR